MSMMHVLAALLPKGPPLPVRSFRATTIDDTNSSSYSFSSVDIGTADAGRLVVVSLFFTAASSRTVSSVTIGGVSASQIVTASDATGGVFRRASMYAAVVPTGTTATVAISLSGSAIRCGISTWSCYNLDSTTPVDSDSAFGAAPTVTCPALSTSDGGFVLANAGFLVSSASSVGWSNVTESSDELVDNINMSAADATTTGSTVAPSATLTGGDPVAYGIVVAASFR